MKRNREDLTFNTVAERYKSRRTIHGSLRQPHVLSNVNRMQMRWGNRLLADVEWEDEIDSLKHELSTKGDVFAKRVVPLSSATINTYLVCLSSMFRLATEKMSYPYTLPRIAKLKENVRQTYLKPEQITELCELLDPYRRALFKFSFHTGLRNTNCRELRWDQVSVNWTEGDATIEFKGNQMKSRRHHEIPLNSYAFAILENQKGICQEINRKYEIDSPWVFPFISSYRVCDPKDRESYVKPMSLQNVTRGSWRKACKQLKLPKDVVFHTARHSFGTNHIRQGTSVPELKILGDWSSVDSLTRYIHTDNRRKRELINKAAVRV